MSSRSPPWVVAREPFVSVTLSGRRRVRRAISRHCTVFYRTRAGLSEHYARGDLLIGPASSSPAINPFRGPVAHHDR